MSEKARENNTGIRNTWCFSENRHFVHERTSFLAETCEMRVQSTRPILLLLVFQRAYFTKQRVKACLVYSSQSSNE
jgi:hypothetical protein